MSLALHISTCAFIPYLQHKVRVFKAGQIASYLKTWEEITSDRTVLKIVEGDDIESQNEVPVQNSYPYNSFSEEQVSLLEQDLHSLLAKQVLVPSKHEPQEFISPIFTGPKSDGTSRLILNLKKLNTFLQYIHFKMECIHTILQLVTPGAWMASIDLKDDYYSVPIAKKSQK